MMKKKREIVINDCFGGFGLSDEAFQLYIKKKGIEPCECEDSKDISREDPILIEVIRELKDKANGKHAELKIVKIPFDVKYQIDEYDGVESIHEKHRSWD